MKSILTNNEFKSPIEAAFIFYKENPQLPQSKNKVRNIEALLRKLGDHSFISNVVKLAGIRFHCQNKQFKEKMNKQKVIPFTNGVFDLQSLSFRQGSIEDCMTMSTRIRYEPYNGNHPIVQEILQWFEETQPNVAQRLYLQRLCSIFLLHLQICNLCGSSLAQVKTVNLFS